MSNVAAGSAAVAAGLAAALLGIAVTALGLVGRYPRWGHAARLLTYLMGAAAVIGVAVMERALITRDFGVKFVADNGSSTTPAIFNVATLWSALEGSILLWALVLCGYTVAVAVRFRRHRNDLMVAWALLVMFAVSAFFFALMVGPADPFIGVDVPAGYDGPGPNPLLQNHILMAFHPPILYLGYVGFTVPFAFAVAALATGRLGEGWLASTRRWTVAAWGFLTFGIVLGAWWSYETLGWGGYWAWDPVENASFLPWLTGTAYLHSVMVQERRGMLRVWNLSLVIATFSLTILGTFLTRSGVLASVHSFTESGIGPAILGFFAVIVAVSLALIAWRGDRLRTPGRIAAPVSREGAFLANNALFAAFAFVVLIGTVFPLLVEAFDGRTISVGNPYFDRMTRPIGFALLFLMAVAPMLPWGGSTRRVPTELLGRRLLVPVWIAAAALVLAVLGGARGWAALLAFGLGGFAGGAALRQIVVAVRRHRWRGLVGRTNGGMIVHLGVVLVAVAFAASQSYVRQAEFDLEANQQASFAGHEIVYLGSAVVVHENRTERVAFVRVDDAKTYGPAIATYPFASQTIGIPSVRSTLRDDVALAVLSFPDEVGPDRVILRVTVQPLVVWLWLGGIVMAAGTVLSLIPAGSGRRRPEQTAATEAPAETVA
ncbi:MAG: heme lyase CcmF/NrfE family subunit [Acidimicrobiaceae bacterium]|nr:heme lyase CcmF/NrfE family subunit [Acidimicrobiaceae bacterium]MXY11577.1 heme lyase CcmF/NrfE family subunit [Acidimicrobiaceae bacterium]MXZ64483.1 heme lyase CcmF/NrfE family subunit [Acidimicrobiaceae bacterium]MYF33752.1 heme lyase CcmF/NrfE family subunit [Acidimicrobiaceae bacterium]MYG78795.1 heme lyase CcmF/NrfE family subunit [Acidimicrobiaceae bacterium]